MSLTSAATADTRGSSGIKLDLSRSLVQPGGIVKVRFENGSSEAIGYGLAFSLQRFEDGRWVRLPDQKAFAPLLTVPAGDVGKWQAIRIPAKAQSGRYRVRKTFFFRIGSDRSEEKALYGYFRVCEECAVPGASDATEH